MRTVLKGVRKVEGPCTRVSPPTDLTVPVHMVRQAWLLVGALWPSAGGEAACASGCGQPD